MSDATTIRAEEGGRVEHPCTLVTVEAGEVELGLEDRQESHPRISPKDIPLPVEQVETRPEKSAALTALDRRLGETFPRSILAAASVEAVKAGIERAHNLGRLIVAIVPTTAGPRSTSCLGKRWVESRTPSGRRFNKDSKSPKAKLGVEKGSGKNDPS